MRGLQVETDQARLSQDVPSGRRTRFLWTGLGFAALMLLGIAAWTIVPLDSHAAASYAFAPTLPLIAAGVRPAVHAGKGFRPAMLPGVRQRRPLFMQEGAPPAAPDDEQPIAADDEQPIAASPAAPKQFDLKKRAEENAQKGAGFNQFDPVLSATSFISRRFGLAGGLGIVALLAATEGNEIVKSLLDTGPVAGSGELVTTPSGLQYIDILVSNSGSSPTAGAVVGFNAKVSVGNGGATLFDSTVGPDAKPGLFKFGQRPFQNVVCEGVEEGIKDMKAGGKRKLLIPKGLAPKGVDLPDGIKLEYEIALTEVLPGYF